MAYNNKQKGQSMAELAVGLAAIIPIILLIPVVGGYLNIDFQSNQASRFAAWQTTVYADIPEPSDNSLNGTSRQQQIQTQTMEAFFRHPLNGIGVNQNRSKNLLWADTKSTPNSNTDLGGQRARMLENLNGSEVNTAAIVDMNAYSDTEGVNVNNTSLFKYTVDVPDPNKEVVDRTIKSKNLYKIAVKVPLNINSPTMQVAARNGALPLENGKLFKQSNSAIIANTWMPVNESYFDKIVCRSAIGSGSWTSCGNINGASNVSSHTPLEAWELGIPRRITNTPSWLLAFPEALSAVAGNYNLVPNQQSQILP